MSDKYKDEREWERKKRKVNLVLLFMDCAISCWNVSFSNQNHRTVSWYRNRRNAVVHCIDHWILENHRHYRNELNENRNHRNVCLLVNVWDVDQQPCEIRCLPNRWKEIEFSKEQNFTKKIVCFFTGLVWIERVHVIVNSVIQARRNTNRILIGCIVHVNQQMNVQMKSEDR